MPAMAKRIRRNPAGTGSIVKKVRNGTTYWVARVPWPGREYPVERWLRTRSDADLVRRQLLAERDKGKNLPPHLMTVRVLIDEWIAVRSLEWEASTARQVRQMMDAYVVPSIGDVRIGQLTTRHIERLFVDLKNRKPKPLGNNTIRGIRADLVGMATWGVERGVLTENIVKRATVPAAAPVDREPLSEAHTQALVRGIMAGPHEALILFILYTGVRLGEALALHWADVDLVNRVALMRYGIKRIGKGADRQVLGSTKTRTSRRLVLAEPVLVALKRHRKEQAARQLRTPEWVDNDLVFPNRTGGVMSPSTPQGWLTEVCKRISIPHVKPHQLRHNAASVLLGAGVSPAEVAEMLGHASPTTTMRFYAHALPGSGQRVADAMAKILGKSAEPAGSERGSVQRLPSGTK
jgi:integrase